MDTEYLRIFGERIYQEVRESCQGKLWYLRFPLILFFIYLLFRYTRNPSYWSIFSNLNLAIHELGHLIFGFMPEFICVAGGTITQCAAPIISMFMFLKQRDFFAVTFCFGWLSTNLFEVSRYIADARAMRLTLVSLGDNPIHDWHYLLGKVHLLSYDILIASFVELLAVVSMLVCIFGGGWVLWQMYEVNKRRNK